MAHNVKMANAAVNAEGDALAVAAASGYLRIYDGSQPATADTAVGSQVLLAELRFGATAFGATVAGVMTANAITGDTAANATGTAAWYRVLKSDGSTPLWDGAIGTVGSGSDLEIDSTAIQINADVEVTSFTHTVTK
ncbi:MAG TPA: hypothetical protein VK600_00375 [Candidatus Saccharimonadales bacterium]|nr:hypothetical protein [Candidatus Saccharimonadales bacterium]